MNRIYSVVWSYAKKSYVVTSEFASRKKIAISASTLAIATILSMVVSTSPIFAESLLAHNILQAGNPTLSVADSDYARVADQDKSLSVLQRYTEDHKDELYQNEAQTIVKAIESAEQSEQLWPSMMQSDDLLLRYAEGGGTATGVNAIALGDGAIAAGENSVAFGTNSQALADNSYALGGAIVNGANTFVYGKQVGPVTFENGLVMGQGNSGILSSDAMSRTDASILFGNNNRVAAGYDVQGSNDTAIIGIGHDNIIRGTGSLVVGHGNTFGELDTITKAGGEENGGSLGPTNAMIIGNNSQIVQAAHGSLILGNNVDIGATNAVGIGNDLSKINGNNSVTIGNNIEQTGVSAVAIGDGAYAGERSIGLGNTAWAYGKDAIVMGTNASSVGNSGDRSIVIGADAKVNDVASAIALGDSSFASTANSMALGSSSQAAGTTSVAIGNASVAYGANSVALGAGSIAFEANIVAVGSDASHTRKIKWVTEGEISASSKDAINGSQLYKTNNRVTKNEGNITNILEGRAGLFVIDPNDETSVILNNEILDTMLVEKLNLMNEHGETRTITGLTDGVISASSTDAINGSQLYETNQNVTNLGNTVNAFDNRITTNENNISSIQGDVTNLTTGKAGLIQVKDGQLVVDNTIEGADSATFNIANADASARIFTGIAAGNIAKTSTDAINGSQLFGTNQAISNALMGGNGSLINDNGTLKSPNFAGAVGLDPETETIDNVYDGLNTLNQRIASGKAGLVQLSDDGKQLVINNANAKDATEFNFANGMDSENKTVTRKLTGVSKGRVSETSTDAINGSQLVESNINMGNHLGGGAGYKVDPNDATKLFVDENGNHVWNGPNFDDALGYKPDESKGEKSITNVYDGFAHLNNSMNSGKSGLVIFNPDKGNEIIFNQDSVNGRDTFNVSSKDSNGNPITTKITGVTEGTISSTSKDAINGSQLVESNTNMGNHLGGGAGYIKNDGDYIWQGPTYNLGPKDENGNSINKDQVFDNVGDALGNLDNRVDKNASDIKNLDDRVTTIEGNINNVVGNVTEITNGEAGLIQLSDDKKTIVVDNGLAKNADSFDISGGPKSEDNPNGDRTLTGVKDGKISDTSSDAINGSQLHNTNTIVGNTGDSIGKLLGGGAKIDSNGNVYYDEKGNALTVNGQGYKTVAEAIEGMDKAQIFKMEGDKITIGETGASAKEISFANGKGDPIRVTGVADGLIAEGSKDAINGGQLNRELTIINNQFSHYNTRLNNIEKKVHENRKVASAGIAGAMAMSSIPYVEYSKYSFGMGIGYYDGESAISIGFQGKINDHARYRLQMSYDTQNKVGLGAGVAFEL